MRDSDRTQRGHWDPIGRIEIDVDEAIAGTNEQAAEFLRRRDGIMQQGRQLQATHEPERPTLRRAIRACLSVDCGPGHPHFLRLTRMSSSGYLTAAVQAMPRVHPQSPRVLVLLQDPEVRPVVEAAPLQSLYALSAAEARVVALVAAGIGVGGVAKELGIQDNTVRVHLKSAYAKTQTRGQADLVRLVLSGLTAYVALSGSGLS